MKRKASLEEPTLPLWVRFLIPFALAVLLGVYPRFHRWEGWLVDSRTLQTAGFRGSEADRLLQAFSLTPWRLDLWERAGEAALAGGDTHKAVKALESVRQVGGLTEAGYQALGEAYRQQGNWKEAVLVWQGIVDRQGGSAVLYRRLAEGHLTLNDYTAARVDLGHYVELAPQDAWGFYRAGLLWAVDDPEKAVNLLEKAAQLEESYRPLWQRMSAALNRSRPTGEAAYRLLLIGKVLGSANEWMLARQAFQQAVQTRPDYAEAWAFFAEANQQIGLDGLPQLKQALQLAPASVVVQGLAAIYWQEEKDPQTALSYLQEAARLEPNNPVWMVQMGHLAAQSGDLTLAINDYFKATELAPQNPLGWQALAAASVRYGFRLSDIGLPAARQAVTLAPTDPVSLDLMGQVFIALTDSITAERFLLRAVEVDPNYAAAHYHLGLLYVEEGRSPDALAQFQIVAEQEPDTPMGKDALQRTQGR